MNTFKWRSFLHVLENKLSKTCVVAMWAQIIITYFHFHRHYCVVCDGIFATSYVHNESRCFQLWHFTVFFSVQALSLSSNSRSHNFNRKLNHNYNFFIHYFDDWQWRRYKDAQCSAASSSIILKFLFLATCHDIVLATVFALHKHTHTQIDTNIAVYRREEIEFGDSHTKQNVFYNFPCSFTYLFLFLIYCDVEIDRKSVVRNK